MDVPSFAFVCVVQLAAFAIRRSLVQKKSYRVCVSVYVCVRVSVCFSMCVRFNSCRNTLFSLKEEKVLKILNWKA